MISFIVYGEPVAQGRPKFSTRGGHMRAVDPQKSRDYKDTVYSVALQNRPNKPLEGPLRLVIKCYRSIPKGFSKKRAVMAANGLILPTTRPDTDNYVKGVLDALGGLMWSDDSQVTTIVACKRYTDGTPRMAITIEEELNRE